MKRLEARLEEVLQINRRDKRVLDAIARLAFQPVVANTKETERRDDPVAGDGSRTS